MAISNSTAYHRADEFMCRVGELRQLFMIMDRLVESRSEGERDHEMQYVAEQGRRLASELYDNLDQFCMDLRHTKGASHGEQ